MKAEGLNTPVDPVYITFLQVIGGNCWRTDKFSSEIYFLQKHVMKVNTQRCLRTTDVSAFSTNNGKNNGFSQQQLQSHLLIMSTPPLKELMYPGSFSTVTGPDMSSASLMSGPSIPANISPNIKSPGPQYYANFTEKPRGILVAHLHEHSSCITKICPLTFTK